MAVKKIFFCHFIEKTSLLDDLTISEFSNVIIYVHIFEIVLVIIQAFISFYVSIIWLDNQKNHRKETKPKKKKSQEVVHSWEEDSK